eukprot:CAMPEP_0170478722 /NCGR_PEP_ID=MMETSP0208-20121228/211_1 /TAXON_ID=197538 /ORGANISM="Strombidium inclinatum, Strain S3" /LENGTH=285 /DNA_ID=CAMNT_0010751027 /DNA_START=11 /DNA_END=870 /DNA_ORIENTATION=-
MASKRKVSLSDYEMTTTLGTGSFGRVLLCKNKRSGEYFAMKRLKKADIIKLRQVDHVISENTILADIDHPFLVSLNTITLVPGRLERFLLGFAISLLPHGLHRRWRTLHLSQNRGEARARPRDVLHCLGYTYVRVLALLNIIYRDLKPENILIDPEGYLKLTDFGFAKYCETRTYTLCGTPEYLAPEVLLNKGHGKPVDWWTLGILTYEMIAGIDPFNDDDPMAIYQKILKGKIKFPRDFDKDAKSLVKHLLVADVTKRYGCLKNGSNDIKNHRWFKSLDWYKLS